MRQKLLFTCCLLILAILITWGTVTDKATAILRQHHDAPGVLHYHSQVSIKDKTGHAWQILLFKVFDKDQLKDINLRLVGFPGVVEFTHPQSLEILTAQGKLLLASDVYTESSPASNVGEYKFTNILPQLTTTEGLKLYLPLQKAQHCVLQIPQNVVTEWQLLVTELNDSVKFSW